MFGNTLFEGSIWVTQACYRHGMTLSFSVIRFLNVDLAETIENLRHLKGLFRVNKPVALLFAATKCCR